MTKRTPIRNKLHRLLTGYLARTGLMLFLDEAPAGEAAPAAAPAADPTPNAGDTPVTPPAEVAAAAATPPADPAPAASESEGDAAAAKDTLKTPEAYAEEQAQALTTLREGWTADAAVDAEFGGEKFAANLAIAKGAMQAVANEKLQFLLNKTGLGDHPEMIRMFLKIAPAFTPDKFVPGGSSPPGEKSAAKVLYPTSA